MKTHTLSLITSLLLLATVSLCAEQNMDSNYTVVTDKPIHNFFDFNSPNYNPATSARAYKEAMELKKHKSLHNTVNGQYQKLGETPKEFVNGLHQTMMAMKALDNNNTADAEKYLDKASLNFEKIFKANPELKMLPVDIDIEIEDHEVTDDNIKAIIENAIRMLKNNDPQEAISLLGQLKNQINITTVYIPMDFYTLGTKVASEALKKGDKTKAMTALDIGFNSVVVEKRILPISLLESQAAILAASVLDKNNTDEASKLLDVAKGNLEHARLLGYTTKYNEDYQDLSDQIHAIGEEIKGKGEVEKLYGKLKNAFIVLINKIKPSTNKAEAKVNAYQKKEAIKAVKEMKNFDAQAKEDEKKILKNLKG